MRIYIYVINPLALGLKLNSHLGFIRSITMTGQYSSAIYFVDAGQQLRMSEQNCFHYNFLSETIPMSGHTIGFE